jgi:hypothetical protein
MDNHFNSKLQEMSDVYLETKSNQPVKVTTNSILEGMLGSLSRGIDQFANTASKFKDATKKGDMGSAVSDMAQGLGDIGKTQGDIDLQNRIKASWERMTAAQQAVYADVNQKMEQLANTDPNYKQWRGLKGFQRYSAEQQMASKPGVTKQQLNSLNIQGSTINSQSRPGTGNQAQWDQWITQQWSRMQPAEKQLYGDDMNKYSDIEKARAKRKQSQ